MKQAGHESKPPNTGGSSLLARIAHLLSPCVAITVSPGLVVHQWVRLLSALEQMKSISFTSKLLALEYDMHFFENDEMSLEGDALVLLSTQQIFSE